MPATIPTARLSRIALFAVTGATALSLAACGGSNNAKPTAASPTASAAPTSSPSPSAKSDARQWVKGLIDSVSGSTIQVGQRSGDATVDFTPSTKVDELTSAQLTDVATGSCVIVRPDRHNGSSGGNAITARSVRISTAVDGKCPEPKQPKGSAGTPSPGGPVSHRAISGQVASVAGNTITVNSAGSPQSTVTVTDTTTYSKTTAADAQAIAQGKCLVALGTKDGSGALQATAITVQQADNGQCSEAGGGHHRH